MAIARIPATEMVNDVFNPRQWRWKMIQAGIKFAKDGSIRSPFHARYDSARDEIVYEQGDK